MKLILKTPKFIKDLIKKIEYQEPVRYPKNFNPIPKPKIYRDGCPYCGSQKYVQLTTRKLCTDCHETYNRMKSVKFDYKVPLTDECKASISDGILETMFKKINK